MFNTLLIDPLIWLLSTLSQYTGNVGISIIILTLLIRLVLVPITLPAMRSALKMRDLQPEINRLKKEFKDKPQELQKAQLELFQQHGFNPAAGCLPNIVQLVILIALYQVFLAALKPDSTQFGSISLFWLNITQPDPYYILPILSALTQLILGLMILPATSTAAEKTLATTTPSKKDDASADDMSAMATQMQQQMLYIMPFITGFIALRFPSGLALYWILSTLFSIIQQYFVSGLGGLSRFMPGAAKS